MSQPSAAEEQREREGRKTPLVVLYLYVHDPAEAFAYPNARAGNSATDLAIGYLECALTQAATLRLQESDCDIALAISVADHEALGGRAGQLIDALQGMGVEIFHAPYDHRPGGGRFAYGSSRYVFDAILAAVEGQPDDRRLWLTDLDCAWIDPRKVFDASPPDGEVGCVVIDYPPTWNTVGSPRYGSRLEVGQLAAELGAPGGLPDWIGGELLSASAATLRELVAAAEATETDLTERDIHLPTEEQLLTLIGARGLVRYRDLSAVARRIQTGRRHEAEPVTDALSLGLWHLPAEKGLSMRRTAEELLHGNGRRLRADLTDPARAAVRFNVTTPGPGRQLRDGAWIAAQRTRSLLRRAIASGRPRRAS